MSSARKWGRIALIGAAVAAAVFSLVVVGIAFLPRLDSASGASMRRDRRLIRRACSGVALQGVGASGIHARRCRYIYNRAVRFGIPLCQRDEAENFDDRCGKEANDGSQS